MHAFTRLRSFVRTARDRAGPLTRATVQKFQRERVAVLSASLAYFALFSLFPLLLIILSVVGLLVGGEESAIRQMLREQMGLTEDVETTIEDNAYQQIVDFVNTSISPDVALLIDDTLQRLNDGGVQAGIVGIVLLFWAASNVFNQINETFQHLWGVVPDPQSQRPIWKSALHVVRQRMLAFGLVMLSAVIFLISLVLNAVIAVFSSLAPELLHGFAWDATSFGGAFALLFGVLLLLFKYLPNTRVTWGDVWGGALGTAVSITLLVNLGALFLGQGNGLGYGVVGSILTLLLWLFLGSMMLYTGASFTAVYARMYGSLSSGQSEAGDDSPPVPFVDAA